MQTRIYRSYISQKHQIEEKMRSVGSMAAIFNSVGQGPPRGGLCRAESADPTPTSRPTFLCTWCQSQRVSVSRSQIWQTASAACGRIRVINHNIYDLDVNNLKLTLTPYNFMWNGHGRHEQTKTACEQFVGCFPFTLFASNSKDSKRDIIKQSTAFRCICILRF